MAISAKIVKELREKTGAGMMDCKKALTEAGGDMEKAIDVLRKAGIAKAEKKSARSVKEGCVKVKIEGDAGCMLETLCETDFVTKNENFQTYVDGALDRLYAMSADGDVSEAFATAEEDALTALIAKIGENMQNRRAIRWEGPGKRASYLHGGGRIGVMVDVEGESDEAVLTDICMHIAAYNPAYIGPDNVPAEELAKEKEIAAAQVAGKPENIIEKIVSGKLNKWYSEVCLVKQPWLRDDKTCLAKLYPKMKIKRFVRWEIGEELS